MGGVVVGRSRRFGTLVRLLAGHLSGVEAESKGLVRVQLRAFAKEDRVVLIELHRPALVDDRLLRRRGIVELPIWVPVVDTKRGTLVLPRQLCHAKWRASGIRAPIDPPAELQIAGVVTVPDNDHVEVSLEWARCLAQLRAGGRVTTEEDLLATRSAIVALMTAAGS
jgi:hypothetical protein